MQLIEVRHLLGYDARDVERSSGLLPPIYD